MKAKKVVGTVLIVLAVLAIVLGLIGCRFFCWYSAFASKPAVCQVYDTTCLLFFIIVGLILAVIGIILITKKKK